MDAAHQKTNGGRKSHRSPSFKEDHHQIESKNKYEILQTLDEEGLPGKPPLEGRPETKEGTWALVTRKAQPLKVTGDSRPSPHIRRLLAPVFRFPRCESCKGLHPFNYCTVRRHESEVAFTVYCYKCKKNHKGFCENPIFCNTCFQQHSARKICLSGSEKRPQYVIEPLPARNDPCENCHLKHQGHCGFTTKAEIKANTLNNQFLWCNTCKMHHEFDIHPPFCRRCRTYHVDTCSEEPPFWPCRHCNSCHFRNQPCIPYFDDTLSLQLDELSISKEILV